MHPLRILWWLAFTILAVILQRVSPGLDFFAPGLILLLQEERPVVVAWLVPLWLVIQEGSGSLAFGTCLLSYGVLSAVFFFGHYLFEAKNFVFMMILGVTLSASHVGLMQIMGILQDWSIPMDRIFIEATLQAIIFPVQWGLMYIVYHHLPEYEQPA